MNQRLLTVLARSVFAFGVLVVAGLGAGCRKTDARGGGPITGKASDPPTTFAARWDETNAFVYHFDSITGTPVPRRNSDTIVQQDTIVAQDLRLGVTAITKEDVRSLQLEIQAARVETTSDQNMTSAFDTENPLLPTEDNAIATRLRRVKGAKITFRLAPSNKILRVDGAKEFTDRLGTPRSVRGAAASVLNKYFSQQFYRDLVEMSFLPTNAVRVGDSWVVSLRNGPGLFNNSAIDLTYTFRGWQVREGTNCARFDFKGNTILATAGNSSSGNSGKTPNAGTEINGTVWFSPGLGVPVQMVVDQSTTRASSSSSSNVRIARTGGGPGGNSPGVRVTTMSGAPPAPAPSGGPVNTSGTVEVTTALVETDDDTETPPVTAVQPPPATGSATPAPTTTVTTTPAPAPTPSSTPPVPPRMLTIKQHAVLTLVELVPVEGPSRPN